MAPTDSFLAASCLALLFVVTCSPPVAAPQSTEIVQRSDLRTVLVEGGDSVGSVLDEPDTRAVLAVIHDEARAVQQLLGLRSTRQPWFIGLVGPDDPERPSLDPSRDGRHGRASADGLVVVVPMSGGLYLDALRPTIRHEVVHVESFRAGLRGPLWWNEGLASEVEAMPRTGDSLELEPLPIDLGVAKRRLDLVTDDALLSDRREDLTELGLEGYEYPVYRSFVRFLLEQELAADTPTPPPFTTLAAAALARAQADLPASLAAWRGWLRELDVLGMIERAAGSADAGERTRASILLADLATDGLPELLTPAADDLAFDLLADEDGFPGAMAFVLFSRGGDLDEARVARLCASPDPWVRLVGLAVRRSRGEAVDEDEVRATWAAVTGDRGASRQLLEMRLPPPGD